MKKISQPIVMNIPFPSSKLSLQQQQHIVADLDNFQAKMDTLKQLQAETSTELDALLPSILDKAFKGEL
jgi:type I restriction enzyme S subunit